MVWFVLVAFVAFNFWIARRSRERAAERAASGMLYDPLYKFAMLLVLVLFGLVGYIMWIHKHAHVPGFLFILAGGIMVALLFLRRSMKWRYPY
jgi:hypothetical protein